MRSLTKNPLLRVALAAAAIVAFSAATAAAAGTLTIYKNGLDSKDGRAEIRQMHTKTQCTRGGSSSAFRFELGKQATECFYRVPVVGRDLQVSATARLFDSTPAKVLKRAYVAVSLRQADDGSRYQLVVWPSTRRYGLRKVNPDGTITNLGSRKAGNKVNGPGKANKLTLRAFNTKDGARLLAIVNGNRVVTADDAHPNQLTGQETSFSIGAKNVARGAKGSFVNLRVDVPDPY